MPLRVKKLRDDSFVALALAWTTRMLYRHRRWFLYPQLVLCGVCVYYTVCGFGKHFPALQFDVNRDDLVGSEKQYHQNYLRFKKEFPTQDDLVVVVESEDPERNRQFVERLGARLDRETNIFHNVFYRGDMKMLGSKALLFLSETNLDDFQKMLGEYRPFIQEFAHSTNLVSLLSMVNTQFRTAKQEMNAQTESLLKALPALDRIITQARDSLHLPGTPPSPGVTALFDPEGDAEQEQYITFAKGRIFLVTAQAPNDDLNDDAVERIRQLVDETKKEVPGLSVGLTGEPVLAEDEMAQSQKDTTLASVVSLVLCALIFIYGYQETGRPVKATLCLVIGLGYTLAFANFVIGHLNILTITFVPILIGLAIDYGVHLISRYEEELRRGRSEEAALTKAMVYTGQGILTGAMTTAGAFLAMWFTNFKGIQEMGVICGGGLVICIIPMMTMLPALLLKGHQNQLDHVQGDLAAGRARIENFWLRRPWHVTGLTLALCALAATQVRKVTFDYNLLHMQSAGLPAVQFADDLIHEADKSLLYGAVIATNFDEAVKLQARLEKLSTVTNVESVVRFMGEDQTRKLAMIGNLKRELSGIAFPPPDPEPADLSEMGQTLFSLSGYLGLAADAAKQEDPALGRQLLSLRTAVSELHRDSLQGDRAQNAQKLGEFQRALFDDVRDTFQTLQRQDNSAALRPQDLPEAMRNRFVGVTGKYLLMVFPKNDVWQRGYQKEFIDQLQSVYPDVTGTPVQLYYYTELLRKSYVLAAYYSLGAIVLLVMLHFRSPLCVALSLVPVGVGFLWLGGLMGSFGLQLNPANIMTLPLVIGIGVTNGIHILNRFAEEQTPNILARSTGKAVLVSGLTAIAGFGSLILAKHQGIHSLGLVMSMGLATCMIAGLTFLPALLNLLMRRRSGTQESKW